jgi:hypothetical protein
MAAQCQQDPANSDPVRRIRSALAESRIFPVNPGKHAQIAYYIYVGSKIAGVITAGPQGSSVQDQVKNNN